MKTLFRRSCSFGLLLESFLFISAATQAADYEYLLNTTFDGARPAGPAPWVDVLFHSAAPNRVTLTISNASLSGSEYVSGLYLNFNTNLDLSQIQLNLIGGNDLAAAALISIGTNQFKAGGDGLYDILFEFPTSGTTRFGAGDFLVYQVSGFASFSPLDFDYYSAPAGGSGPFLAAAHIQSIGNSDKSGWIRPTVFTPLSLIPEPEPFALILAGLLVVRLKSALRKKKVIPSQF